MLDIAICINSAGRHDNIKTITQFPVSWKKFVYIIVPHDEYYLYRKSFPNWKVIMLPKDVPHFLSSQRQWVIDNIEHRYIFFMDDDLYFKARNEEKKLRISTEKDMVNMLKMVSDSIKIGFPMVGIGATFGNNRVPHDYTNNTKVSQCFCFDKKIYNTLGISLAPFEPFVMQDVYLVMSWLTAGYPNRVIHKYCRDSGSYNSSGGCSRYRTFELMKKVVEFLASKFPKYIHPVKRYSKSSWKQISKDGYRWEINCDWKKAYEFGITKRKRTSITNFL